jgi:hypothetical protein
MLLQKAAAAAALVAELRDEVARLHGREAAARGLMSQAVLAAFAERAGWRAAHLASEMKSRRAGSPRPTSRLAQLIWRRRAALLRLSLPGQILLVAASGAWRPSGRPVYDLRHIRAYLRRGADPGVTPPSLFDQARYLALYPDVAAAGLSPLLHYLAVGEQEGRIAHPLFDAAFYADENAEALLASRHWPLAHFVSGGAQAWRNPHPLFDMAHYHGQNPQLAPGEDPPTHYLREGWRLGLSPHPLFHPAWYRAQMPEAAAETPPLLHFIQEGAAAGLSPHPLFDPTWYLSQAPEAADSGQDPLRHYLAVGAQRGLSPSPKFDPQHYAARRGDALKPGVNPLIDYLQDGAWTVAEPAPGFATAAYVAAHPELAALGHTPLEHWVRISAEPCEHD